MAEKKTKSETKTTPSILEEVGKKICKKHGFKEVYVTSDGVVFRSENDAINYAKNLQDKKITKVEK